LGCVAESWQVADQRCQVGKRYSGVCRLGPFLELAQVETPGYQVLTEQACEVLSVGVGCTDGWIGRHGLSSLSGQPRKVVGVNGTGA